MRKGLLIGLVLVFGVVGCDTEEDSVGAFTSSLSAEEATVQDLTFAQQSTFCGEFAAYSAAKGESLENDYGCFGPLADAAETTVEATDPCADADYVSCEATVAEIETCAEEYATFGYLTAAALLTGASDAANEAGAEAEEGGEMSIDIDFSALGVSCDAPAPTAISAECTAVAAKCPEVFGGAEVPQAEVEGGEAAEEEGDEHAHEEGEEHEEEGGEATE